VNVIILFRPMLLQTYMTEYCHRDDDKLMRHIQYDRLSQQQLGLKGFLLLFLEIRDSVTFLG